jgi:ribosomal protein L7Ae-like RNA K-turn-binding protein
MRKVRKQTKQILVTGETISFPKAAVTDTDVVINIVVEMAKQKKARFGINSVFKAATKGELKFALIPNCDEFLEKYQVLFHILEAKKIPVLTLDIKGSELAKHFGNMKSLLVIGLICDVPDELLKLSTTLKRAEGLPNVKVINDTYTV